MAQEKLVKKSTEETEDIDVVGNSDTEDEEVNPYEYLLKMQKKEAEAAALSSQPIGSPGPSSGGVSDPSSTAVPPAPGPHEKFCTFESSDSGGLKCSNPVLPSTKFCQTHILNVS